MNYECEFLYSSMLFINVIVHVLQFSSLNYLSRLVRIHLYLIMTEIDYREVVKDVLAAHTKMVDFCRSIDTASESVCRCLTEFVAEIRNDRHVIPALKSIKDILSFFHAEPDSDYERRDYDYYPEFSFREDFMEMFQGDDCLSTLVINNLEAYMSRARQFYVDHPYESPEDVLLDDRYSHAQQIEERLNFLTFWIQNGKRNLLAPQVNLLWKSLYVDAADFSDKLTCWEWFSERIGEAKGDASDLDPDILKDFFINNILQMDPAGFDSFSGSGFKCFRRFFEAVNIQEKKIILMPKIKYRLTEDLALIGLDYVWRIIISGPKYVSNWAATFLVSLYTDLGPSLLHDRVSVRENFIASCFERLKNNYDAIAGSTEDKRAIKKRDEYGAISAILTVLRQFVCFYERHAISTPIPTKKDDPTSEDTPASEGTPTEEDAPTVEDAPTEEDTPANRAAATEAPSQINDSENCSSESVFEYSRRVSFLERLCEWASQLSLNCLKLKTKFLLKSRVLNPPLQVVLQPRNTQADNFDKLFHSKAPSDVIFLVGEEEIPAHKLVLTTRFPYFEQLFASGIYNY